METTLVIFGAGASFASQSGTCPPLGEDLLEKLMGFSLEWARLPEEVILKLSEDIEAGMGNLFKDSPEYFVPLQWDMARFFYGFDLKHDSLYSELLCKIAMKEAWQTKIATLNYDRLLYTAALLGGVPWYTGSDFEKENAIEICYPHGACFWGASNIQMKAASDFIMENSAQINCPVTVFDWCKFRQLSEENFLNLPPVMSAFSPEKISQVGHSFIMEQRERFRVHVASSNKIAIIGVQLREHDIHIWEPLKNSKAELLYVTKGDPGDSIARWKTERPDGASTHVLCSGFKEHFDDILSFLDLR